MRYLIIVLSLFLITCDELSTNWKGICPTFGSPSSSTFEIRNTTDCYFKVYDNIVDGDQIINISFPNDNYDEFVSGAGGRDKSIVIIEPNCSIYPMKPSDGSLADIWRHIYVSIEENIEKNQNSRCNVGYSVDHIGDNIGLVICNGTSDDSLCN